MNEQRRLLVVSGPSGAGKDTVVKYLMEAHPEIEISVSATTRAMRPGEEEGVNYYYMTNAQFEEKLARGEILEHVNYCGKYYGTPKSEVDRRIAAGTTVVLVIEVVGAANIKRMYPESTLVIHSAGPVGGACQPPARARHRGRGRCAKTPCARRRRAARKGCLRLCHRERRRAPLCG